MREWLRTTLAVGATAVIGYAISQRDQPLARVADLEKQLDTLRTEVQDAREVRPQVAYARVEDVAEAAAPRSNPEPSEEHEEAEPKDNEQNRHREEEDEPATSAVEQDAYIRFEFEQSPPGDHWSIVSEKTLNEKFREHLGSAHLRSLECRKDLCRAEVEHVDQGSYEEFLSNLVGNSHDTWKGELDIYRVGSDQRGSITQSLYFARPGAKIPRLR